MATQEGAFGRAVGLEDLHSTTQRNGVTSPASPFRGVRAAWTWLVVLARARSTVASTTAAVSAARREPQETVRRLPTSAHVKLHSLASTMDGVGPTTGVSLGARTAGKACAECGGPRCVFVSTASLFPRARAHQPPLDVPRTTHPVGEVTEAWRERATDAAPGRTTEGPRERPTDTIDGPRDRDMEAPREPDDSGQAPSDLERPRGICQRRQGARISGAARGREDFELAGCVRTGAR